MEWERPFSLFFVLAQKVDRPNSKLGKEFLKNEKCQLTMMHRFFKGVSSIILYEYQ